MGLQEAEVFIPPHDLGTPEKEDVSRSTEGRTCDLSSFPPIPESAHCTAPHHAVHAPLQATARQFEHACTADVAHLDPTWTPPGPHLDPIWTPPGPHLGLTWTPPLPHLNAAWTHLDPPAPTNLEFSGHLVKPRHFRQRAHMRVFADLFLRGMCWADRLLHPCFGAWSVRYRVYCRCRLGPTRETPQRGVMMVNVRA